MKAQGGRDARRAPGLRGRVHELWPILRRNLALAGKQLGMTFLPAMIASIPVLFILAWMSNAFDARPPAAGEPCR